MCTLATRVRHCFWRKQQYASCLVSRVRRSTPQFNASAAETIAAVIEPLELSSSLILPLLCVKSCYLELFTLTICKNAECMRGHSYAGRQQYRSLYTAITILRLNGLTASSILVAFERIWLKKKTLASASTLAGSSVMRC